MSPRARGEGKTPHRTFRIDNDVWDPFVAAVDTEGKERTAVIRELLAWYGRVPGAKLPKRPPANAPDAPSTPGA